MESTGGREFVGTEGKAGEAGRHSPETCTLNLFVKPEHERLLYFSFPKFLFSCYVFFL